MLMETVSFVWLIMSNFFFTSYKVAYPKEKEHVDMQFWGIISTANICVFCISAPSSRKPGDPLVISDIKKGSVAHR